MKAKKYTKETIKNIGMVDRKFPSFTIGDTIIVSQKIKEGDKERIQDFEGDVIAINNSGVSSTFMIRRIGSNTVAIERIFPYYSPLIDSIKYVRSGKRRRAKLYYMRDRVGKAARIKPKLLTTNNNNTQEA
jgi:large subunit ribosomal protein L19